jgi:hypothetical protein
MWVTVEHNEEKGESSTGDANGTVLAGQEPTEIVGILKSIETEEKVIITAEHQNVNDRLSEEAKGQIKGKEVNIGSKITFTTYSMGDDNDNFRKKFKDL